LFQVHNDWCQYVFGNFWKGQVNIAWWL